MKTLTTLDRATLTEISDFPTSEVTPGLLQAMAERLLQLEFAEGARADLVTLLVNFPFFDGASGLTPRDALVLAEVLAATGLVAPFDADPVPLPGIPPMPEGYEFNRTPEYLGFSWHVHDVLSTYARVHGKRVSFSEKVRTVRTMWADIRKAWGK